MIEKLDYTMQNVFQLVNLEKQVFGKDAWTIGNIQGEFRNKFSHFFAKVEDGQIVAYGCLRIMFEEAQICNIAVLESHRRQGLGTQIVQSLLQCAREEHCLFAELEVNTANTPAVELYKKCGFQVEGIRKNFYRKSRYPTNDAYTMICRLEGEQ